MHDLNQTTKNLARGAGAYISARQKLAQAILAFPGTELSPINTFLTEQFLKIQSTDWMLLPLNKKDWPLMQRLRSEENRIIRQNYFLLLSEYISVNAQEVVTLSKANHDISAAIIQDAPEMLEMAVASIEGLGRQSLFAYKITCAGRAHSNNELLEYFSQEMRSNWLKRRFLYPLVYYYVNLPTDPYLDTFLSYVTNKEKQSAVERQAIKYLLRDELMYDENFAFKAYIALLSHPYDACEFLTNHVEIEHAMGRTLTEFEIRQFEKVCNTACSTRAESIYGLVAQKKKILNHQPTKIDQKKLALPAEAEEFLCKFIDAAIDTENVANNLSPIIAALARMRYNRYPRTEDFDLITNTIKKWDFLDVSRLIDALLVSIYMLPRREVVSEIRSACRLVAFFDTINSFILSSPSAGQLAKSGHVQIEKEYPAETIRLPPEYNGRLWIKAVHWHLNDAVHNYQIGTWLKSIREWVRIAPAYLTGIDWEWIDSVIDQLRLKPFRGNPDGVYTLLLNLIENRKKNHTELRVSLEPFAKNKKLKEFVGWLSEEFGVESIAFVRYFLTPENVLLLRLASNYTAALSGRIEALQECYNKYPNHPELLTEAQFVDEWKGLTSALLIMNIGRGQFEIPWAVFKKDALESGADQFEAYRSLQNILSEPPLLGRTRMSTPHRFRNGMIVTYEFENSRWPLVVVILSIIEAFMGHPSFGIEVLLSTRFRHDTLMREFVRSIESARSSNILGTSLSRLAKDNIISNFANTVYKEVDCWLINYMQTRRPEKPQAYFDFAPTQSELADLVSQSQSLCTHEDIIEMVRIWIEDKLKKQIQEARNGFLSDLQDRIKIKLKETSLIIIKEDGHRADDVQRIFASIESIVSHEIRNLTDWFSYSDGKSRAYSFKEIRMAVEGLFEDHIKRKELLITSSIRTEEREEVGPDKARLVFDLLSELLNNSLKFRSREKPARMRIIFYRQQGTAGWLFSSYGCDMADCYARTFDGHPYTSITDEIFQEGRSGLSKVAALSATLIEGPAQVRVLRKKKSFHVLVPFRKDLPCQVS